jgi:PPOX class probable F420-dependent enzyme
MPAPSVPSTHVDLLDASVAVLATIGPDGRPQVSGVWFLNDDGVVKLSLNTTRQKVKNLSANPAVTVFIHDPANPARYLEIRGDAALDPDDEYAFADRLAAKYGNPDLRAMDGPDGRRVVVTVNAVRINAVDLSAG